MQNNSNLPNRGTRSNDAGISIKTIVSFATTLLIFIAAVTFFKSCEATITSFSSGDSSPSGKEVSNVQHPTLSNSDWYYYPLLVNKGEMFIDTNDEYVLLRAKIRKSGWTNEMPFHSSNGMTFPFVRSDIEAFEFKSYNKNNLTIKLRQER